MLTLLCLICIDRYNSTSESIWDYAIGILKPGTCAKPDHKIQLSYGKYATTQAVKQTVCVIAFKTKGKKCSSFQTNYDSCKSSDSKWSLIKKGGKVDIFFCFNSVKRFLCVVYSNVKSKIIKHSFRHGAEVLLLSSILDWA